MELEPLLKRESVMIVRMKKRVFTLTTPAPALQLFTQAIKLRLKALPTIDISTGGAVVTKKEATRK